MIASHHLQSDDTIAAIATASGGGIGIIRLSGPSAISITSSVFSARNPDWSAHPRLLSYGSFVDPQQPDRILDTCLAVPFHAPRSFTGEEVVELHLHGGALHLRQCLRIILDQGARMAEPGEFTKRAFLNGQLDLTRAEAIADLVSAQTDAALDQARAHLRGALFDKTQELREATLMLRAQMELNLDFVEEDVPLIDPQQLADDAEKLATEFNTLAATYDQGRLIREGARVVLAGVPNAGKSSLFNRLVATERAIVTPIAGTTRDTLEEPLDILGIPVLLIDTAGLRETDDPVEAIGVQRTTEAMAEADLVIRLIPPDAAPEVALSHDPTELVVYSKADLKPGPPGSVSISATTGEGLDTLYTHIADRLGRREGEGLLLVRERQWHQVLQAAEGAQRAAEALRAGHPTEFAAVDLQDTMDALAALVGDTGIEDVLDRLFSSFCIGK